MQSRAATVSEYLASLPDDRRAAIQALRTTILENIDTGFEEGMQYGMIGYFVPHSIFPAGYHCDPKQPLPFAGLASQKQHLSLYLMGFYTGPSSDLFLRWFKDAWARSGKKPLDMGKACIRFKKLEDVPLEVIGEAFRRLKLKDYVASYEASLPAKAPAARSKASGAGSKARAPKGATPKGTKATKKASRATPGAKAGGGAGARARGRGARAT